MFRYDRCSGFTTRANLLKALGPGILMAGAAIGGSHLVSSSQAGALYGWSLVTVLLLVNFFKYPFFLYGQRYRAATGESILHGYRRLGRGSLYAFFALNLVNAALNIAGVSMITASLSINLGLGVVPIAELTAIMAVVCAAIIVLGRYQLLDKVAKIVVLALTVSTLAALTAAWWRGPVAPPGFSSPSPWNQASIGFLILFMGWMPAPIDVAAWPSLWMDSRERQTGHRATMSEAMVDFHIGYLGTVVTAFFFLGLGALVLHGSGQDFPLQSAAFAGRFISMYVDTIGEWSRWIIAIAAFSTMFSTTLTCVDGWPRSLAMCTILSAEQGWAARFQGVHNAWIVLCVVAAYVIVKFLLGTLGAMLQVAMVISFLTSPVFAYLNYRVIRLGTVPEEFRPGPVLRVLSWGGMVFFILFSLAFLAWFFLM